MRKFKNRASVGVRIIGGVGVVTPFWITNGQCQYSSELTADNSQTQNLILGEYPDLRLVRGDLRPMPGDLRAHFFASAKLLRLTDYGKTKYGTALISAHQVRWYGMKKELTDKRLSKDSVAWKQMVKIFDQELQIICMIDDLVMYEALDENVLSERLSGLLSGFDSNQLAGLPPTSAKKYLTAYGKVIMQFYAEQKCWLEEELQKKGFDLTEIREHKLIDAFRILNNRLLDEDRLIYSCGLDQGDLFANLNGIACGLTEQFQADRELSFKQALESRGDREKCLSLQEFYKKFLKDDVFTQAISSLPEDLATGRKSAEYWASHRYVVSSNLPQEPHTIVSDENVTITYHPIRGDSWIGTVSIVVRVPNVVVNSFVRKLFDQNEKNPVRPTGQKEAFALVRTGAKELYDNSVRSSGILLSKSLYASVAHEKGGR